MKLLAIILFLSYMPNDSIKNDTLHKNKAYEQIIRFEQKQSIHNKLDSIIFKLKERKENEKN